VLLALVAAAALPSVYPLATPNLRRLHSDDGKTSKQRNNQFLLALLLAADVPCDPGSAKPKA
jgi:hypothetical protein